MNRDKKVVENNIYVKGVFAMLVNLKKDEWKGEAKKTSSYSTFKLLSSVDYTENIICGSLKKNKVYKKIIFEKI